MHGSSDLGNPVNGATAETVACVHRHKHEVRALVSTRKD